MPKAKEPTRLQILQEIFEHLQQVTQWMPDASTNADYSDGVSKYLHKAETLVEALEVNDCGSIGGFDKGQESQGLVDRFLWLLDKYNKRTDIKESCGFTPDSIHKYFSRVGGMRDEILNEKA